MNSKIKQEKSINHKKKEEEKKQMIIKFNDKIWFLVFF